jgi:uncharacterized membrane protein
MRHHLIGWLLLSSLIIFTLSACSTTSALLPVSDFQIINNGSSFGQSFTAQNTGLSGVSVLLAPADSLSSGSLLFHLRVSPQSNEDLALARLPLSEITHQTYYKFDFSPQNDSQRKDYFLRVELEGEGQVKIFTATADSYLDGALYENQIPQDAQLGFRLEYDSRSYLFGLFQQAVEWIGVLFVGFFAFILPGWALLSLLWRGWDELNWSSKLGLSGGLSLAIYPLILLWTNLVGLHLGPFYAWLPPIAGLLALAWKNRNVFIQITSQVSQKISPFGNLKVPPIETVLADVAFLIILGLIIISRLWVIRFLDVPLFGDSYQHTMITQLIINHGGLFNSWEPYADLTTFTYHFGFHSASAVYHWISGVSVEKSLLWTGQLINILAILGLYPLAIKIAKNRWAGVFTILVAGLLSPMPMYYVNWGRYTQLAGQAVLPAVIWMAWSLLERPFPSSQNNLWIHHLRLRNSSLDFGGLVVVWLAIGGIALTHYRVLILFLLFFPAYIILTFSRNTFIAVIERIVWFGMGSIVLFAPWFIHVYSGKILKIFTEQITNLPAATTEVFTGAGNLLTYLPIFIWTIFFLSLGWGLWKRNKRLAIFILWWLFIILATNPNWIGLPGSVVITNFAMFIAFYIPASVVIGAAFEWIPQLKGQSDKIDRSAHKNSFSRLGIPSLALFLVCVLGLWGLPKRIKDLNIPTYALVTRPDLRAMEWIRANTPADASFLINSFFAYNDTLVVGSDGGWWLPILAERRTTLPPITYGFEQGSVNTNIIETNNLFREIQDKGITNPDIISMLAKRGIKYIYIGQRQGVVNYSGPKILDPQIINDDPLFKAIFHQDRVWIYEIEP